MPDERNEHCRRHDFIIIKRDSRRKVTGISTSSVFNKTYELHQSAESTLRTTVDIGPDVFPHASIDFLSVFLLVRHQSGAVVFFFPIRLFHIKRSLFFCETVGPRERAKKKILRFPKFPLLKAGHDVAFRDWGFEVRSASEKDISKTSERVRYTYTSLISFFGA